MSVAATALEAAGLIAARKFDVLLTDLNINTKGDGLGLAAAFLASVFWLATLTRFPLSHAYPFVAFTFVLVIGGGGLLFGEPIRLPTIIGLALIVTGITIASQG